jgi:ribosome production factor 1
MRKRKADDSNVKPASADGAPTVGQQTSEIKNKLVRSSKYHKLKHEKSKQKRIQRKKRRQEIAKAEELGLEPPAKQVPKVTTVLEN